MKILSIGSDRNLFKPGAAVRQRICDYGQLFEELHIIVFAKKNLGLNAEQIGTNVWIYPTNSSARLFYLWDAFKIGQDLRGKFTVITAQDPFEAGLVAWWLKLATKAKLQLQVHTDFLSPKFKQDFFNWFRVPLARFLLPRADGIRVVSQKIAAALQERRWRLKTIPVVLPIWVDAEKLRQTPVTVDLHRRYRQFNKIILMVSRLEPEKQVDLALKYLASFLLQEQMVGLVIVGSGSEEQKLKNMVEDLGVDSFVKFEGWQENLATYYKTADLFLMTSRYEGYGVALVEAAACGLPVVATDVGVALELGATIIEDFAQLGSLVKRLLSSPVKVELKRHWLTKAEYLEAYRQALTL